MSSSKVASDDIAYLKDHAKRAFLTHAGSFLYTAPYFTDLPVADRLTAVRLLGSLLEHDLDEAAYAYYDSISARELFSQVSHKLYRLELCCQIRMQIVR